MKKSIRNIFVLAVLGFMGLPLFFFDSNRVVSEREKRKLAEYPFLLTDNRINKNFFSEYDSYFQDHFGFREQLIRLNEKIPLKIQKSIESIDAFSGKNGWYFINFDRNLKDFAKKNLLTADELKEFKKNISNTMEWCKAQNIPCVFLICPNKHSVYPEFYPFERPDGITRADQMTTVFEELNANYIFPRDYILLRKADFDFPLYYETDTHWNPQGAYLASILLREKIQKFFPDANFPKIEYETKIDYSMTAGDILPMLGISESKSTQPILNPIGHDQSDFYIYLKNEGRDGVHTKGANPSLPRALIFRDSFFAALEPFVSPLFSEADYQWKQFDESCKEIVLNYKPDIIIFEAVERYAPSICKCD